MVEITSSLAELEQRIKNAVRDVPDYPKTGIVFKDITPVLSDPLLVNDILETQLNQWRGAEVDAIVAIEARGFIVGSLLAHKLNCAFVPVRKLGKLPYKTLTQNYSLEYGTASVEMHVDAIRPGWKVLIHDDLLATGGTACAAAELVTRLGGELTGFSFLINLSFLPGAKMLEEKFHIKPFYQASY